MWIDSVARIFGVSGLSYNNDLLVYERGLLDVSSLQIVQTPPAQLLPAFFARFKVREYFGEILSSPRV